MKGFPDLKNLPGLQSNSILRGLGIQPHLALFVVLLDVFLCGGEMATFGLATPFIVLIGVVLMLISFVVQKRVYGDSFFLAAFKSIILGVITAIPTPITPILVVIGAILPKFGPPGPQEEEKQEMKQAKGSVVEKKDEPM